MENLINKINNIDCLEGFKKIKNSSIDLVITSPPYNLGIPYDSYNDNLSINEYFLFIEKIAKNIFRVLKDDGRVCINIPIDGSMSNTKLEKEKIDIIFKIKSIFYNIGFKYKDQILWDKNHLSKKAAWGSYESASCPNIVLPFEAILIFYKKYKKKQTPCPRKEIIGTDFQLFTNGHWQIQGSKPKIKKIKKAKKDSSSSNSEKIELDEKKETKKLLTCPVPYPEEIVKRLLLLYSYDNDIVLDPFSGNGTTCIVAKKLHRQFIGFEISENYYTESIKCLNKI